jgi:hypothetical protein
MEEKKISNKIPAKAAGLGITIALLRSKFRYTPKKKE